MPFEMGFRFAVGFQKKGSFGQDVGSANADNFRPDIVSFALEKVLTDQTGVSTTIPVS
jgi:hypothetical protein